MHSAVCPQMCGSSTNQRPGNGRKSVEHDQSLNQAWGGSLWVGPPNVGPIWSAVCLQICKNSVERDQKLIMSGETHNSWPTKFDPNLISGSSSNAWKLLDQSDASKSSECSRAWLKSLSGWEGHNVCIHQIYDWSHAQFVQKCVETIL